MNSAARAFGIHRITLYRVLKGQFPDHHGYRARYAAFIRHAHKKSKN